MAYWKSQDLSAGHYPDSSLDSDCSCAACARSRFIYPADSYQFPVASSDAVYKPLYEVPSVSPSYYERYYNRRPDFVREFFKPWDVYPIPLATDGISKLSTDSRPSSTATVPTTSAVYSTQAIQPSGGNTMTYWKSQDLSDGHSPDVSLDSDCTCAACARSRFLYPVDSYQFPIASSDVVYKPIYEVPSVSPSYYERYYNRRPDFVREFFKPWDVYPIPWETVGISKLSTDLRPSSTATVPTSSGYSTPGTISVLPPGEVTPPPSTGDDAPQEADGSSSNAGLVVGAAAGAVIVVVIVIIIIIKVVVVKSAAVGSATATTMASAAGEASSSATGGVGSTANGGFAADANAVSSGHLPPLINAPQLSPVNIF